MCKVKKLSKYSIGLALDRVVCERRIEHLMGFMVEKRQLFLFLSLQNMTKNP
jgi:hypothetical protein